MTDFLVQYLDAFGYLTLFAAGFAEYAGVPVVTVPVLITAGGLSAAAGLDLPLVTASAAAGGLAADVGWFLAVRWRGDALVDSACGLTSNPNACVLGVEEKVSRLGPVYLLPAKFIPGAGNLVGPAAGLSGMSLRLFAAFDAAGLLLWAGVYSGLGALFSSQIRGVVDLVARYQRWGLIAAAGLMVAAGLWRIARVVLHRQGHDERRSGHPA